MADINEDFISLNGHSTSGSSILDRRFIDLIYWRDVRKSFAVFASGIIVLTSFACYSFISVVSYLALSLLAVAFGLRMYARFARHTNKTDSPFAFLLVESTSNDPMISDQQARDWLDKCLPIINVIVSFVRRAFFITDYAETIKCVLILYLLTHIGACFNLLTLVYIAFFGLFTFPRLYEQYKTQLDVAFGHLQQLVGELLKQGREKMGALQKKKPE